MLRQSFIAVSVFSVLTLYASNVPAAGVDVSHLPEPLTLEFALQLAGEPHPDIMLSRAEIEQAEARHLGVKSEMGISTYIAGRATWVEPARLAPDRSHNDSSLSYYLRKRLYDFGRSSSKLIAAETDIKANRLMFIDALSRRRIEIMERFFDVLLSDLEFIRDREAVAVAYYRFQRLQGQRELGQASALDLSEAESEYMEARRRRSASESRQRLTRELLAEALNRPGMPPVTLVEPLLPHVNRDLPDVEGLIKDALARDPAVLAMRAKVEAARKRLDAARAEKNPVLSAEMEASLYEREFGSRDRLRAGLILEIPLFTGGLTEARIASSMADLHRLDALLSQIERSVRQMVLEAWEQIKVLRSQIEEDNSLIKYRDLYLDRSRTIYEQGLRAYLGDAMVKYSEARLRHARTRYALALAWERLDALTGRTLIEKGQIFSKLNRGVNDD